MSRKLSSVIVQKTSRTIMKVRRSALKILNMKTRKATTNILSAKTRRRPTHITTVVILHYNGAHFVSQLKL